MDRTAKLKKLFPGTNLNTRLVVLGNATKLVIGDKPLLLHEYKINEEEFAFVAYDPEENTIYVRLVSVSNRQ